MLWSRLKGCLFHFKFLVVLSLRSVMLYYAFLLTSNYAFSHMPELF